MTTDNTITVINDTIIRAGVFIVPNHAGPLSEFGKKYDGQRMVDTAAANGKEFNPDADSVIQVWLHAEESLGCDNLSDHYFEYEGENYRLYANILPASLFTGMMEGDEREMLIPIRSQSEEEERKYFRLLVKAAQRQYRYRRFGDFQDVFQDVLR